MVLSRPFTSPSAMGSRVRLWVMPAFWMAKASILSPSKTAAEAALAELSRASVSIVQALPRW